jgi:hypothetical protein
MPAPNRQRLVASVGCDGFLFSSEDRIDVEAKAFRYASPVRGISFVEVPALQFLDALGSLAEVADDVANQSLGGWPALSRSTESFALHALILLLYIY